MSACELEPIAFGALPGVDAEDWPAVFAAYRRSCRALADDAPELRKGCAPQPGQRAAALAALACPADLSAREIRAFFEARFQPYVIAPGPAFFTAYYRPEVAASLVRTPDFAEALLARPDDLVTLQPGEAPPALAGLAAGRRLPSGELAPYPTRAEIDAGAQNLGLRPVAYVADAIEAFMIHVQGSARLILPDGQALDLTYAGRNGRPYTSIGRILVESGAIAAADMSLARLKAWVRDQGQVPGQPGRALLHRNESFVFFAAGAADAEAPGPIGAAGVPLTPDRSIAVDRTLWSYGLPFWVEADLPDAAGALSPYARMMIAQDTGSAIVGAARADLYFGSGARAGERAGNVRHHGRMIVLLPKDA